MCLEYAFSIGVVICLSKFRQLNSMRLNVQPSGFQRLAFGDYFDVSIDNVVMPCVMVMDLIDPHV